MQQKGAISREIDKTLDRIDQLIQQRKEISDRVQASTDQSRMEVKSNDH